MERVFNSGRNAKFLTVPVNGIAKNIVATYLVIVVLTGEIMFPLSNLATEQPPWSDESRLDSHAG